MKFTYKPEGTEPDEWKVWIVDPKKMLNVEVEAIEDKTGMTFPDWHNAVMEESTKAIHGLLWILLRRTTPGLDYDAVGFTYDEYELDLDDAQKAELVVQLEAAQERGDLTPEGRQALEEYRASLPVEDVDAPKASPEPSSEPDTSGTSPTSSTPREPISIS